MENTIKDSCGVIVQINKQTNKLCENSQPVLTFEGLSSKYDAIVGLIFY